MLTFEMKRKYGEDDLLEIYSSPCPLIHLGNPGCGKN